MGKSKATANSVRRVYYEDTEQSKTNKKLKKNEDKVDNESNDIPLELMEKSKTMAPMRKEDWEKQQNVVRRVFCEDTGRYRLIKGDGEVLEEIVSKDKHIEINKQATKGDGEYFQKKLKQNIK
ncbi:ADP-ribosylation factor-like protein 6-interacting protein 4 [Sitophilus oryzae]|uniref:ADP-ribosylation factor-like protein 6-interacting protein 4 n=1 Tax=Sitophilus oryzae TaxID=7048 RepID=A0A6J2XZD2_SITOR|nr:ADP-ribosylation factor-like protein 6-interacting protein 4 [Sitophilus oryzae]